MFVCLFVCLFVCMFVCMFVCLYVCVFVCYLSFRFSLSFALKLMSLLVHAAKAAFFVFPVALTLNDLVASITYVSGASMQVFLFRSHYSYVERYIDI